MQQITQYALNNDEKMHELLLLNSEWYKYLNRDPKNYQHFVSSMKKKYKLTKTDKISETLDNIDLITTLISTIK